MYLLTNVITMYMIPMQQALSLVSSPSGHAHGERPSGQLSRFSWQRN